MTALPLARRTFDDRRRGLVYWAIGVGSYVAMILAFYPTAHEQSARFNDLLASYPKAMLTMFTGNEQIDFGSASSFLNTYLYTSMVPIMILVLAIGYGASSIAGEEDAGTLDLVMAYPVRRRSIVVQKAVVLLTEMMTIASVILVIVLIAIPLVHIDVSYGNLALATVALILLATDFGLVAVAVGAMSGRRGLAAGVASGVAGGTYLVNSMWPLASWLEPFRYLSPFYWATNANPLANGVAPGRLLVLITLGAVLLAAAIVGFERRDLRG